MNRCCLKLFFTGHNCDSSYLTCIIFIRFCQNCLWMFFVILLKKNASSQKSAFMAEVLVNSSKGPYQSYCIWLMSRTFIFWDPRDVCKASKRVTTPKRLRTTTISDNIKVVPLKKVQTTGSKRCNVIK